MKRIILILSLVICIVWQPDFVSGQNSGIDLTTPLSIDPDVKIGRLDNGLVYYIRKNKKPEKRVELRLVVNAGSILENEDQLGLAHFMEHMNFNGTKTFPKNELIDFLQKTGVRFGGDINAYTGFDETVYMLQLPTDDTALVSKGFQVLEDWAHNALLDGKEIDKERGIITEEWRLGLGAQDRMMKKIFPVILKGSRYADRIPIGKVEVIQNFKHETLRDFYRDWYRPDLQAVIVVGDMDPALTETRIKNHFEKLKNPDNERARTAFDLPGNAEPLIAIATDKEATENFILMFYKHPLTSEKSLGDFRIKVMAEIFTSMINNRFSEISQKPESPYVFAGTGYGRFLARTRDAYFINAMSKENQIDKSLEVLLAENERVKRFGFTQTELDRQKEEMISKYEKEAKEFDKTESASFCSDYVGNYLSGDAIPGPQKKFRYLKNLLPGITLDEINSLVKQWVTDSNMALVIMAPDKENVKVPTEQNVLDIIKQSKLNPLTAYVDNYREEPLATKELTAGAITGKSENEDLGFTELKLANGITVILKPTAFKNDEIVITGYSLGGNSLYPDEDFMSANFATQIIDMSGAGSFDNIELQKKLKGKNLQIAPYLEDVREGFKGSCAPKDFETVLQLIYLYVNQPRKDSTAFRAFMSQMENQLKFMKSSPVMSFYDTLFKSVYPGYKRMVMLPTQQQLDQVNLDKLYTIFKDRFADAGDFKFFLVGNFQTDTIVPLLQKYLGNLPNLNRNETWKNTAPEFARGITDLTIHKGSDPQSMVGIVMSEKITWSEKENLHLDMIREILGIKLVEVIREKMSGVYSPQIMLNRDHYPESNFQLIVMFGCSPKMTGKLTRAVFSEIGKLRKKGPTETDLVKAKEALIRKHETDLQKNEYWLSKLESYYYNHDDAGSLKKFNEQVQSVTADDLRQTCATRFNPDHYVRVVLMPEKK
ncbi:MAG: insulinase family protein [Alphaproteobacteria bacterium]|nr:insulinase family protein [Alphaproteobacteria bacterium]